MPDNAIIDAAKSGLKGLIALCSDLQREAEKGDMRVRRLTGDMKKLQIANDELLVRVADWDKFTRNQVELICGELPDTGFTWEIVSYWEFQDGKFEPYDGYGDILPACGVRPKLPPGEDRLCEKQT